MNLLEARPPLMWFHLSATLCLYCMYENQNNQILVISGTKRSDQYLTGRLQN